MENFDSNEVDITNYNGLNIFEGIIVCHYDNERKEIFERLIKENRYKVETLQDGEILYKFDDRWIKI